MSPRFVPVSSWALALSGSLMAVSALVPAMLEAQAGTTPASSRARVVLRRPAPSSAAGAGGNVCLELESSPSPLVHAPEGLALLRLKKQLESAALTLEQRQQLERNQLQRIVQVQRGVDSLMQVVVRSARDEGERAGEARPVTSGAMTGGRRMLVTIDSGYGPVTVNLEAMMRGVVPGADSVVSLMVPQVERTLRALQPDIDRFIRLLQPQVAAFAGEAEASLPGGAVAPSGYMGLSLSGAQIRIVTPEGVMTSHCDYPLVETVDVGSPAARAGIAAGDTLVAYNGRDVTQSAVNYAELITAGTTVRVRVRRSGKPREVPVMVDVRREEERAVPARVMVRGAPFAPQSMSTSMFRPSGVALLAGAQFVTMDAELAQSLSLEPGVLVLRVPAGTPAADAGLKGGDVVRAVNGQVVRDVTALRRALAMSRDVARMTVQARGGASRVVVLEVR
jgi:hypothetical protein